MPCLETNIYGLLTTNRFFSEDGVQDFLYLVANSGPAEVANNAPTPLLAQSCCKVAVRQKSRERAGDISFVVRVHE